MKVHPENVLVYSVVQKTQKNSKKIQNQKVYIRLVHYRIRCGYMAGNLSRFSKH